MASRESADDDLGIARVLLRKDLFEGARSKAMLAALVERAERAVERPRAMILCRLLGFHPRLGEERASRFWDDVVAHQRDLSARLGRHVHIRVAALDLIAMGKAPVGMGFPILIGRRVLSRIVELAEQR